MKTESIRMIKEEEIGKLKDKLKDGNDNLYQKKIEEYEMRMKEANREHKKMIETLHSEYIENLTVWILVE